MLKTNQLPKVVKGEVVPAAPEFDPNVRFVSVLLDDEECPQHFCYMGATGSGKTAGLRLLLQDVVPDVRMQPDTRLLYYDAKQDGMSMLRGMDPDVRIVTLNPFDSRGAAWNMSADVIEPRVAIEIAFTLIPEQQESQPFFSAASRHLLYGVMLSYLTRRLDWGLADVLRGLGSAKVLRSVLAASPYTKGLIPRYFGDARLLRNILSTLATKLLAFEPIAASWEAALERISLTDWIEDSFVLMLGNAEISRHAIDALNRCIFKRASDLHLNQSESTTRRTWWVVDELSEAGKLDGIISLCKKSRSKGGCVVICCQTLEGLRDPALYGPYQTAELLGQIGHRFFGRLECPETAEWAARLFGDQEIRQVTRSHSGTSGFSGKEASGSVSFSENEQFVTQKTVLPSEFMSLPPCNDMDGLTCFCLSRSIGAFWSHLPGHELFDEDLAPSADVPDFVMRPVEHQLLRPWTKEERLLFAPPRKAKRKRSSLQLTDRTKTIQALKDLDSFLANPDELQ